MAVSIVISGCCGRMGRSIAECALQNGAYSIGAVIESKGHESIGKDYSQILGQSKDLGVSVSDNAREALLAGDVLIEFTSPSATIEHLKLAQELKKPIVIGTTGFDNTAIVDIKNASTKIPILFSPNMSVGVNLLFELGRIAAQKLGSEYGLNVVETHHKHKKDSPSGTAKRIVEVLKEARPSLSNVPVRAIREGEIVGEHTVVFTGPSESLEITHRAQKREVFAEGALKAAAFLHKRRPGLYDMSHVVSSD